MPEKPEETYTAAEIPRETLAALKGFDEPLPRGVRDGAPGGLLRPRRLYVAPIIADRLHRFKGGSAFVAVSCSVSAERTPCPSCGSLRMKRLCRIRDVETGGLVDVCGFCARYLCGDVEVLSVH